ncbi:MAG: PQQ-binding-like beta-propeller repeat protein [Armatimonadaceae bacterium]
MKIPFSTTLHRTGLLVSMALLPVVVGSAPLPNDSPQFRGVERNGRSDGNRIAGQWPDGGPKLLWSVKGMGEGHAAPSVAKGRIYGMGLSGNDEVVWALDEKTGKEIWATRIDAAVRLDAPQGGYGPRSTPTVEGNRIYAVGVAGMLVCIDVKSGKLLWQSSLVKDHGGRIPAWGYCESPLIEGDRVIATPGGKNTVVAFKKSDGTVLWKASVERGGDVAYASAIAATYGGKRQVIQFLAGTLAGIDVANGGVLWTFDAPATPRGINCSTPLFQDGLVFAAAAYQHGGALGRITVDNGKFAAEQVYFTKEMRNHHGGMVLDGKYLYGFDESNLTCMEFATGKVLWQNRSVGKGSVSAVGRHLICRSERGPVALVEMNPAEYVEKGRFEQPERSSAPSWPYPVVANNRLLLRDQDVLLCYDLSSKGDK